MVKSVAKCECRAGLTLQLQDRCLSLIQTVLSCFVYLNCCASEEEEGECFCAVLALPAMDDKQCSQHLSLG